MTKNKPIISVVTINFNGKRFLKRCLGSTLSEKGKPFEIIVVDNGSTDQSAEFIRKEFGNEEKLKLITLEKNVGPAEARNIGVRNSKGKYILILDNDTKIKAGWYERIINFFEKNKHKKIGLVQPKLLTMGTNKFNYAGDLMSPFGFLVERARSKEDKGQFDKTEPIFSLNIASAFFKKEVFEKIGEFDKDYYFYWEEADLSWRSWLYGYQNLFHPNITVWHAYGTKEKEKDALYLDRRYQASYFGSRNMFTTLIKNLGARRLVFVLPIAITCWVILAILFSLKLEPKMSLVIFRGLLGGVINLPRTLKKRILIQSNRKIDDRKLFAMVGTKKRPFYYLGKGISYVLGKPF